MAPVTGIHFFQTGWVVEDIDEAMRFWLEQKGAGPFFVRRMLSPNIEYRGTPTAWSYHVALAQVGDIQVELIQQVDDGPSAYRDVYPRGTQGFHHLGAYTDQFDADLQRYAESGVSLAALGVNGSVRFAYFDTSQRLGCMTELIDRVGAEKQRAWFAEISAAHATWDGTDPIREVQ